MRLLLLMLGISTYVVGIGTHAEAQNYPWCLHYGTGFGGHELRVHDISTMYGHREWDRRVLHAE